MYCNECCDRGVCRACQAPDKMVRFTASTTQCPQQQVPIQHSPVQQCAAQFQLPQCALQQQSCRQPPSCLAVPEPCGNCDAEPRVGMCFVSEGPDGLNIDCNVPIPSSFNFDLPSNLRGSNAPPNEDCCVSCISCGAMQQQNANCVPMSIPVICSCFDQMQPPAAASQRNSNAFQIESPQANTPPQSLTDTSTELLSDTDTFQRMMQQQQQQINYFMDCARYSIQPPDQEPCCCDTRPQAQQGAACACQQPPSASPPGANPQLLRFDLPCLLTQLRTDNCSCESQKQTPVSLQVITPLNPSTICGCPPTNTAQASTSCQTCCVSTSSQMDGMRDVGTNSPIQNQNYKPAQSPIQNQYQSVNQSRRSSVNLHQGQTPSPNLYGPPLRPPGNATSCKKCTNCWHYPRYPPNYFYHPGVLRLYPDKNYFYKLWR